MRCSTIEWLRRGCSKTIWMSQESQMLKRRREITTRRWRSWGWSVCRSRCIILNTRSQRWCRCQISEEWGSFHRQGQTGRRRGWVYHHSTLWAFILTQSSTTRRISCSLLLVFHPERPQSPPTKESATFATLSRHGSRPSWAARQTESSKRSPTPPCNSRWGCPYKHRLGNSSSQAHWVLWESKTRSSRKSCS